MKMFSKSAIAALGLALAAAAHADSVTGHFDVVNGSASSTSGGTVTFTLAADGTIDATLSATSGIFGFAFSSPGTANLAESNFAPATPDNAFGWLVLYGNQNSGFLCMSCGSLESWTIGTAGEFTSVQQALGGTGSQYDFFLFDQNFDQWGANASTVPEPANVLLLLAGLGLIARRAARRQA